MAGEFLLASNGEDVTKRNYRQTMAMLQGASRPVTLELLDETEATRLALPRAAHQTQ